MSFAVSPMKLCIPATVFYWKILAANGQVDDITAQQWKGDDGSIHIYRTELPWTPIQLDKMTNKFAIMAWTAVLSIVITVTAVVCLCCLCWKLYPRYGPRRQSANAALVPNPHAVRFAAHRNADRRTGHPRRGNSHSTGVTNSSFTDDLENQTSNPSVDDRPPAYSTVISQTLPSDRQQNLPCPQVIDTKTVETPPPAYITLGPFQ